jgi:hypothetical protein
VIKLTLTFDNQSRTLLPGVRNISSFSSSMNIPNTRIAIRLKLIPPPSQQVLNSAEVLLANI